MNQVSALLQVRTSCEFLSTDFNSRRYRSIRHYTRHHGNCACSCASHTSGQEFVNEEAHCDFQGSSQTLLRMVQSHPESLLLVSALDLAGLLPSGSESILWTLCITMVSTTVRSQSTSTMISYRYPISIFKHTLFNISQPFRPLEEQLQLAHAKTEAFPAIPRHLTFAHAHALW